MNSRLTTDEVASILSLTPYTVRKLYRQGKLLGEKEGTGKRTKLFFFKDSVYAYLHRQNDITVNSLRSLKHLQEQGIFIQRNFFLMIHKDNMKSEIEQIIKSLKSLNIDDRKATNLALFLYEITPEMMFGMSLLNNTYADYSNFLKGKSYDWIKNVLDIMRILKENAAKERDNCFDLPAIKYHVATVDNRKLSQTFIFSIETSSGRIYVDGTIHAFMKQLNKRGIVLLSEDVASDVYINMKTFDDAFKFERAIKSELKDIH